MTRGFALSAVSLAFVCSVRRQETEISSETPLVGPPLCDAAIVADVCKQLNEETVDHFGPTTEMDYSVVHAAELSQYFSASLTSIRFFLKKIGATNRETDELLLSRHAFSVSCQEMCDKTIASIPASRRPTYSDVGCYPAEDDSSSPSCTIDLSPEGLQNIPPGNDTMPVDAQYNENNLFDTKVSETVQQEIEELDNAEKPDKSFAELQAAFAQMFRVYPVATVTQPHENEWPEGAEVPEVGAEAGNASLLETNDTLSELSRNDLQVALRNNQQAVAWISRALRNVNGNLAMRWFKSSDSRTLSSIRSGINYAANVLNNVEYKNGRFCGGNPAAYVRPFPPLNKKYGLFGPFIVSLCPGWYKMDTTYRIRALVHEAYHHMWNFKYDWAYYRQPCLALPGWKATRNADSWSFFVCEAAGNSCP